MSYVFRFYQKVKQSYLQFSDQIETVEADLTKNRLILIAQESFYSREIYCLHQGQKLYKKSSLLILSPFLDENGIGISNAELNNDTMYPIIIPEKSHLVGLIVDFTQTILLHAKFQIMLHALQQAYYIPK